MKRKTLLKKSLITVGFVLLSSLFNVSGQAKKSETRCGWFNNPTPANYSLYDKDSEWIIGVQGGYQIKDFDWPDFKKQWVPTNNSYGYGCACFQMTVDPETTRALAIKSSYARPLSACRKDKVLRRKWGFTMK